MEPLLELPRSAPANQILRCGGVPGVLTAAHPTPAVLDGVFICLLYIVSNLFFSDLDPGLNIPDPVPDREDTTYLNMFFKLPKKFYSLAKGTNYKLLNTLLCIRIQYSCDI